MDRRRELSGFLRSRRAGLRPEDVGLPLYGDRRRVPGLRREELAQLAGVSISHYTRLEQGQYANISIEVIDAVGRVLRLRAEEREYLHNLVRPPSTASRTRSGAELRTLQYLVDSMTAAPAYITGRYGNALAWNRMTALVLCDFDSVAPDRRTWTHAIFDDTLLRTRLRAAGEWDRAARFQVGYLRLCWSRFPDGPEIPRTITDLLRNDDFRRFWAEHLIHNWPQKHVRVQHELVGPLELNLEVMRPDGDADVALAGYTAIPGSPTDLALRELAGFDLTETLPSHR